MKISKIMYVVGFLYSFIGLCGFLIGNMNLANAFCILGVAIVLVAYFFGEWLGNLGGWFGEMMEHTFTDTTVNENELSEDVAYDVGLYCRVCYFKLSEIVPPHRLVVEVVSSGRCGRCTFKADVRIKMRDAE